MDAHADAHMETGDREALGRRIDRLESREEIRELSARYALAVDVRDGDAWVGLFPEDVRVGRDRVGRAALKAWFDETMRERFTGTAHVTGNHIIEFQDDDHARGVVYSRNEHEMGDRWIVMTMMYWDRYERIGGRWYFRRRLPLYWYATHQSEPPVGPNKMRWPDGEAWEGSWHEFWPSWRRFWENPPDASAEVAEPAPAGEFLAHLRRGAPPVSVRVR